MSNAQDASKIPNNLKFRIEIPIADFRSMLISDISFEDMIKPVYGSPEMTSWFWDTGVNLIRHSMVNPMTGWFDYSFDGYMVTSDLLYKYSALSDRVATFLSVSVSEVDAEYAVFDRYKKLSPLPHSPDEDGWGLFV